MCNNEANPSDEAMSITHPVLSALC